MVNLRSTRIWRALARRYGAWAIRTHVRIYAGQNKCLAPPLRDVPVGSRRDGRGAAAEDASLRAVGRGAARGVIAPPYDVIDAALRAELVAKSPYNVVEIDLPVADDGGDKYLHAETLLDHWRTQGALVQEDEPAFWALDQEYAAPDGSQQRRRGLLRAGARRGVRRRADPPARAHASRPEGGPAAADAGDASQPVADLQPVPRPHGRRRGGAGRVGRPGAVRYRHRPRGHGQHALADLASRTASPHCSGRSPTPSC